MEEELQIDEMDIFTCDQDHVENFICALPCSEELARVDNDPEDFALLLDLSAQVGLQCSAILGPRIDLRADKEDAQAERVRDFSLPAHSLNSDSAMRPEVATVNAVTCSKEDCTRASSDYSMSWRYFIWRRCWCCSDSSFVFRSERTLLG